LVGLHHQMADDEPESGSEGEEQTAEESGAHLKPKVWRAAVVQEFNDNVLIRSCLEIVESGETMKLHEIHFNLFERYHARIENQAAHRRPDELLHPHKLLECTAFRSQKEWDEWKSACKFGMGKCSASDPNAGLLTDAHANWASKKWEKWKLLKREIHEAVQKPWSQLCPNNVLPSGVTKLNEMVEKLRKNMFDVWKFAKTSAKSKVKYADQEMTGPTALWHPNWWAAWKAMGPAAGSNCSATFMSECFGMKVPSAAQAFPSLLENHFQTIAQSSPNSSTANFSLQSKKEIQKESAAKRAQEAALLATPQPLTPATPEVPSRSSRSTDTKVSMDVRKHEIQRLHFLIASPYCEAAQKAEYELELFNYMQLPVLAASSSDFFLGRAGSACSATSATMTEKSARMNAFLKGAEKASMSDAATIGFRPIVPPFSPPSSLHSLLKMPVDAALAETSSIIDYDQEEAAVMRGSMLPSCPVDIAAADFANSCLNLAPARNARVEPEIAVTSDLLHAAGERVSKPKFVDFIINPVPTDGSCCPVSIFESLLFLRRDDEHFLADRLLVTEFALRESLVKFISDHADSACDALGGQTFRDGINHDYVRDQRELRDSDFYRRAMEAEPPQNPEQHVTSFWNYCNAMRQPKAFGDEFMIAAAAMDYKAQICVLRQQDDGSVLQTFHQAPDATFRIYMYASIDHYEWLVPASECPQSELPRITVEFNPPSLKSEELDRELQLNVKATIENGLQFGSQTQEEWERAVAGRWHVQKFDHGTDSFFEAFVHWRNLTNPDDARLSVASVRDATAQYIYDHDGKLDDIDDFDSSGFITLECSDVDLGSDRSARRFSLQQYCNGIAADWPAGDLEIRAVAERYEVVFKILEHNCAQYNVRDHNDPFRAKRPQCRLIRIKASPSARTRLDSYTVLFDPKKLAPFFKYTQMMRNLPVWNVDMEVVHISDEVGRGVRTLRKFFKGEVAGLYDGHRCDQQGRLITESAAVRALFQIYPQLNRHVHGGPFKASHCVCLGRNHSSGLVIDGHPLCDPVLDADINSLGRFALSNAATSDAAGSNTNDDDDDDDVYYYDDDDDASFCAQPTSS